MTLFRLPPAPAALVLLLALVLATTATAMAADPVWIEGEAPTTMPSHGTVASVEHPQWLSGGKWLMVSVGADQVDKVVSGDGVLVPYAFDQAADGRRELWARIGLEGVRSPFRWRLDGGAWADVAPTDLTCDLVELSRWCEAGWIKLGESDLKQGPHILEFELIKSKDAKGQPARILFALDAICISEPGWVPNEGVKPGQDSHQPIDAAAAAQVFSVPPPAPGAAQTSVSLAGPWEICRDDEQLPVDPATPIAALPAHPRWRGITVPGDRNVLCPELLFAHRFWYRTHIDVPQARLNGSFRVVFPCNCLNTTVWVNGTACGFDKNPLAKVTIDITHAIKAGSNELWVGIRDVWYARSWNPNDPMTLRRTFNIPLDVFHEGFQSLAYPVWNLPASGMLCTPQLIVAGALTTTDAFCMSSVSKHTLTVQLTEANPGTTDQSGSLVCQAVDDATGAIALTMPTTPVALKAGTQAELTVVAPWPDPKLWWPDQPNLYRLRTTITVGGAVVDVHEVTFGFREWAADGSTFTLNGVKWQGFNEQGNAPPTRERWLAEYRDHHYAFARLWPEHNGTSRWYGLEPAEAFDFFDRSGVVVRRQGTLDGEAIGYYPVETDKALLKLRNGNQLKQDLFDNWRDQIVAQVKGERNHPSIMIWSMENEFLFIDCINLWGGLMDQFEAEVVKTSEAIHAVDPTRFTMCDGGGATKSDLLPVHGDHYPTDTAHFDRYPGFAYGDNATGGGRGRWTWDMKRPRFIGEELFAAGINPAYGYFGGEQVFLGKSGNRVAVGTALRVISEGYRWRGIGACDFCQGGSDADGTQYNAWQPRVVLCRQWDWTFASGQQASRTFKILNTSRFADPLTFTRTLTIKGVQVWTRSTAYPLAAGAETSFDEVLAMPQVSERSEGELVLALSAKGQEVFRAVKAVSVLPTDPTQPKPAALAALGKAQLFVFDPNGGLSAFLAAHGIAATAQDHFAPPETPQAVWLIGKDALSRAEADTTACAAYAADGGRVLVLEQEHPLRYQALAPAEIAADTNEGRIAFGENYASPILHGLSDKDFFTWEPGEVVWRNAYRKPSSGAQSLMQCNMSLTNCPLVEIHLGKGLLVLSQLVIEEKLAVHAVPQQLLTNLLDYAAGYQLRTVATTSCVEPALAGVLESIGLKSTAVADPVAALADAKIAVVSATPANLAALAAAGPALERFTSAGGHLILHGLSQAGLADYDKVVGWNHVLRPFRRERVSLAPSHDPLMAGVGQGDVALYSSEAIFPWQSGNFIASDTFSTIVDLEDVAPFATLNNDFYYNLVNGMTSEDGWKYICNHSAKDNAYIFTLPRREEITTLVWVGNAFYNTTSRIELVADGDEEHKRSIDIAPTNEEQTLPLDPPLAGTVITVRHASFSDLPDKHQTIGCDNIALIAKRPADYAERVRPLLNIGGLVSYPRGSGGIVLCNLLFKAKETPAANGVSKRAVLTTILRNLDAPFTGGKMVIAGAHLVYQTIDLSKEANLYRDERGWFGNAKETLKAMPSGEQSFAGVTYLVYEFPTSPVPTVVGLGGVGVADSLAASQPIPVHRTADALFFLQTAKLDKPATAQEKKDGKRVELGHYLVTWADGLTATIPLDAERDLADWRQKTPAALPGAQLAWSQQYAGSELWATTWSKQWTNTRPGVEIATVTLVAATGKRGVPVLIALTAAAAP